MNKIYRNTILFLITLIVLTGCENIPTALRETYDDNDVIISQADSFIYISREGSVDIDESEVFFKGFYGKESLLSFSTEEEEIIEMDVELIKTKGDFKLCLINPDNSIITIANSTLNNIVNINLLVGKSRLVIVGRDAIGSIRFKIEADDQVEISKMTDLIIEED